MIQKKIMENKIYNKINHIKVVLPSFVDHAIDLQMCGVDLNTEKTATAHLYVDLIFEFIWIRYYVKLKMNRSMGEFRQKNTGNHWNMKIVFRPAPVEQQRKLAASYREISGRNTASMVQRFPVFS